MDTALSVTCSFRIQESRISFAHYRCTSRLQKQYKYQREISALLKKKHQSTLNSLSGQQRHFIKLKKNCPEKQTWQTQSTSRH